MKELQEIFTIEYPKTLVLNQQPLCDDGIPFISSTGKNNGVSAKVEKIEGAKLYPKGAITVPLKGTVLQAFLQNSDFYCAHQIAVLISRKPLSDIEKLFYCVALRKNKYRYNYGRQADNSLAKLLVPSPDEIPKWVKKMDIHQYDDAQKPEQKKPVPGLGIKDWQWFAYKDLFDIRKGKRLTKADMIDGKTRFIGSTDNNNGVTNYIQKKPNHSGNVITVNYNGSVAEAFYQPTPFWASDDVNILYPKFQLSSYIGLFLCTLIKQEKYRFNYGRKWHKGRMEASKIKLPVDKLGKPNWKFMENYIKLLPYSSSIERKKGKAKA